MYQNVTVNCGSVFYFIREELSLQGDVFKVPGLLLERKFFHGI